MPIFLEQLQIFLPITEKILIPDRKPPHRLNKQIRKKVFYSILVRTIKTSIKSKKLNECLKTNCSVTRIL